MSEMEMTDLFVPEFDSFESAFDDEFTMPERRKPEFDVEESFSPTPYRSRAARGRSSKKPSVSPDKPNKMNAYDTSLADQYEQIVATIKSDLSPLGEVTRIAGAITPVRTGVLMDTVQAVIETEHFTKDFLVDVDWSERKKTTIYKVGQAWVDSLDSGYSADAEAHEDATVRKVMSRLDTKSGAVVRETEFNQAHAEKVVEDWNNSFMDKVMKLPRKVTTGTAVVSGTALVPVLTVPMPAELGLPLLVATTVTAYASCLVGRKKNSYWQERECSNRKMLEDAVPDSLTEWNEDRTKQFYDLFEDVSERGIFMDRVLELCKKHKLEYRGEIQVTPMGKGYGIAAHLKKPLVMFTARRQWDGDFYSSYHSSMEWNVLFDGNRLYRVDDDNYDGHPIKPY